jgi:pullulanase
LTSQGIPFFQAGEEMARTKQGDENSYRSPDSINQLDWDRKSQFTDLLAYYQGLIRLRRNYRAFRLRRAEDVRENLRFLDTAPAVIAYTLEAAPAAEATYSRFLVIFNGATAEERVFIPGGDWDILVNGERAGIEVLGQVSIKKGEGGVLVPEKTALILGKRIRKE